MPETQNNHTPESLPASGKHKGGPRPLLPKRARSHRLRETARLLWPLARIAITLAVTFGQIPRAADFAVQHPAGTWLIAHLGITSTALLFGATVAAVFAAANTAPLYRGLRCSAAQIEQWARRR